MERQRRTRERPLARYARLRDFERTPEPAPDAESSSGARFVVHKHDASRLHYDLRLEIGGVLASWAVPKGPSLDPSKKRLAVETEDHPLAYGDFEGRIPDGSYGAGDTLIWDRGTFETQPPGEARAQREKGHLRLMLSGEKLEGLWHLVRTRPDKGGKPQWLLFKAKDEKAAPDYDLLVERPESVQSGRIFTRGPQRAAQRRRRHPEPSERVRAFFPPMLALAVEQLGRETADLYELKYDGYRALAALANGRIALRSRNGRELESRFPELAHELASLPIGEAVIDGEVVALDPRGVPSFERLADAAARELVFYAFDLLSLEGEDLRRRPIEERRDLLESLLVNAPSAVRIAERIEGSSGDALAEAKRRGFEGIIAKRRGSIYRSGRSSDWRKRKLQASQELAIVGYTESSTGPGALGALLLAVAEGEQFVFAGKVGTGFDQKTRSSLRRALEKDAGEEPTVQNAPRLSRAHWVEPRLVAQVRFTGWTSDGKLRHPVFLGLRDDKSPSSCVREPAPVARSAPKRRAEPEPSRVKLTHPDRVYFPREGITKTEIADYFEAVHEPLLRALADRPVALEHFSKGIDEPSWFQQNVSAHAPSWLRTEEVRLRSGKDVRRLIVDSPDALRWLAQHAVLTIHIWASRFDRPSQPDWVTFDLDPADGASFSQVIEPALAIERLLRELGLGSVPKTSGKRGLHVLVPIHAGQSHEDAVDFALALGHAVAEVLPDVTLERRKEKRRGRLYLDCLQNGHGKTIVAPYAVRARAGAPVSAPLRWDEVGSKLTPDAFTIRTMPSRLDRLGDLFAPALSGGPRLPRFGAKGRRK